LAALAVVATCAATALVVRAQARANPQAQANPLAQTNAPPAAGSFGARPGSDSSTDCIIPKTAGILKGSTVEDAQDGTTVWSTYEDTVGAPRVSPVPTCGCRAERPRLHERRQLGQPDGACGIDVHLCVPDRSGVMR
jgi:hypothetical protein